MKCFLKISGCEFPNLSTKISNHYKHENIQYRICKNCKLIFQYPLKKTSQLKKIYTKEYFIDEYTNLKDNQFYIMRKNNMI